jgi:histidinol-phosphatase
VSAGDVSAGVSRDGWLQDLALAHRLCDVAAGITLRHLSGAVVGRDKADGTPVCDADLEVEAAILSTLAAERPTDAVLGEESGARAGAAGVDRRWIVDPLDATVAFIAGEPGWGTYVALEEGGEIVLGVINHPADGRRYWATKGNGTTAASTVEGLVVGDERRVQVSSTAALEMARFTAWPPLETPRVLALRQVSEWVEPSLEFLVDLLEGRIDVLVSQGGEVWDHAAEVVIVEEAGGKFRDPEGGRRLDLRGGLYTNRAIDAELLMLLEGL